MTRWGTTLLALGLLSTCVFAGEEPDEALDIARKKMELLLKKGEVLEKLGDLDGAIRLYDEALAIHAAATGGAGAAFREVDDPRSRGESRSTRAAVSNALAFLARYQDDDGKWDCDEFTKHDPRGEKTGGAGGALYDVGVTSLALLAFLGDGHTDRGSERDNPYALNVRRGLRYLMNQQDDKGCFGSRASQHFMYNTALATAAMCEAYSMTRNPRYKEPAARAVRYLLDAQNPFLGWRYEPRGGENDTSVTGWCVYALERARRAGLIDGKEWKESMSGARAWVEKVTDAEFGQTGYNLAGGTPARPEAQMRAFPAERSQAMTASGIVTRITAGESARSSESIRKGLKLIGDLPPRWRPQRGDTDLYYWFWGTRACYLVGGPDWKAWNKALQDAVLDKQYVRGAKAGSWDPVGPWGGDGGRVYSTAILTLALQTYREPRPGK